MEDDSCFLHLSPAVTSNNESDVIGVHSPKLCGILKTPNSLSSLNNKSITSLSLNSAKRVTISVERQLDSCRRLRSYSPYGSIWSSNMKSHSRRRRRLNNLSLEALLDQDVLSQWCEDMATPPKCNQNIFSKNINSKESKKNVARVLFDVTNVDSLKADKSDSIIGLNTEFDYPNISSSPTLFQDTTKNKNCSLLDLDSNNSLCMSMEHDKENNWISSPTMVFEKEDKYRTNSSSVLNSLTLESLTHTINEKVEDSDKLKYKLKRKFSLNENLKSDNENCFLSPAVTTKQKISQKISYEMKSRSQSTPIEKKKLFYTSKESQTKESLMNPFYNLNVSKPDIMLSQDFALTCFNQNDENYIKKHEKHKRKSYLNLTNEIFSYSSNDRLLNNSINDEKQFLSPPMIGGFKSNSQFLLSGIWNCSDFYETLTNNVDLITDFNESSPILHAKISASQSVYINRTQSFKNENVTPSSQELVKREKYPCSVTIHKNNLAYSLDSSIKSICTDNYHFVPPVIQSCTVVNQTIVQPCLNQTTLLNNLVQNNNNNISMQSGNSILVNNENLRTKKFSYPKHENRFQNTPQKENIDNKKMQKSGLRKSINYSKNTILPDGFINMDNLTQISADDINSQKFNGDTMSNSLDQNCPAKFSENINQDAKKQQVINKIEVNLLRGFQPGFETKVKGSDKSLQEAEKLFQEESNNIVEDTLMKDFNGFQTGLGKKVEISKKSLQEAKKLFQEEGDNIVEDTLMKDFNGFQTGLGKKVEISKKSLQEAKKLFPEENNNIVEDALMKDFNGFQTCLGKKVEISKKSLQEAKKLFQEESNNIVEDTLMKDFNGFQTCLGKKVEISKKSLQEAKKLFPEENNNIVEDALMKDFNGFQTCLGKKVEISKKSLQEAKKLFQEESNNIVEDTLMKDFNGFQTGLGKKVEISKKSLQEAKKLFQEESNNIVEDTLMKDFNGFQTGLGKKVEISKKSLQEAKKLFQEESNNIVEDTLMKDFNGFQTGLGKKVEISKKSLQEAKKLFQEESNNIVEDTLMKDFNGFQTGLGKKVEISKKSLQEAKKLFQEESNNIVEDTLMKDFNGFQTGLGKKVEISKKSLQEAKKLFQEESNNIVEDTLMKDFNGFQTGLGKKVEISKKSLQEAKKLFQEESNNIVEDTLMKDFNGFQTGLGKKVEISKKSLQEAKKLFQEESNNIVEDTLMKDFNGFQTGLGKKVEISKKSLQEAKKLFQEESNNIVEDTLMKDFNGFQTGLGKKVEISKKSLQEAKKLFQEESNNIVEDALMKDFNGFQTGLDKKVEISKKSLQEAKKLFPEENNKLLKNKPKVSMFESFQTDLIANQEVDVFKKSTQSANELLQEHSSNDVENSPVNSHQVEKLAFLKKHSSLGKNCSINQSFSSKTDKKKTSSKRNDSIMINNLNCDNVAYQHSVAIASGNSTPSLSSTSCNKFSKDHELLTKNNIKHVSKLRKRKIVFSSCDAYEYDRDAKFILPLPAVITSPDDVFDNCNTTSFDETLKPLKSTFTTPFKMNTTPAQNISSFKKESERKSFCPFQKKRKEGFQTVEIDPIYQKQIGKLYQSKKNCKLLGVFVNYCLLRLPRKFLREELHSFGIKDQLINLNPSNALMFQFYAGYYFSESVLQSKQAIVGDGVKLHFNEEMMITVNEFKQALLNCSSVDKNLINSTWIENHYKWIVWKLASYERMYPEQNAGLCLTPSNVMYQLKYRYDKEVEFSERSCLKCICERDDVSSRRIILCVSSCGPDDQTSEDGKFIWVTDGWYEIKASLDYQLSKFVEQGKIDVGTKLCIYGAELIGSEKACPPLEISQSTMLKLSANSTRRARWHAKLGYQREKVAFPVSLKSLYTDGGLVGCVKVLILRKYPMQWMEKVGGRCLFRNFLAEEQVKKKYEEERSIKMEQLYVKLKKELEMKKDKNVKKKKNYNIKLLNCGKDIFEAIDGATDPAALEQLLSDSQKNLVIKYKQNLTDQFQSELKKRFEEEWKNSEFQERSTVQLQRFRVQCMCNTNQNTILSVWKPTNDINELWNEGVKLSIYNLSCTKNRYKHIKSQVQLSTTHTSKYFVHENEANLNFHSRKAYSIADLCRMNKIPYNEVDIVGFAVKIEPENCMLGVDQTVYLCDDRSKQFLIVKFHGGLKAYSVENIVKESHLVSFSSLTWDHNDKCYPAKNIFCIYSDLSNVSNVNPPYMSKAVKRCKNFIELHPSFLCELRAYLDNHLKTANSTNFTPGNLTPKSNFQNKNITMDVTTPVLPTEKLSYRHRLQMKKRLSLECYREPKPLSVLQANDRNVLTAEFKPPSVKTKTPVQGHPEFSSKTC
ncbi:breast cancer type 2 susceptibility protein homolog isoform X4 [Hydra vulgaris]|uniref:Breast cancer type 2 susceptibility protein homolog isoform X4 n=1 Tax=Hydra vulgaris TaxID=6087 RepID=A0ABM4D4F7_HYDVU